MLYGFTTFKCDECGKRFVGPAAEFAATAFTSPCRCPQCNSWHTYPASFSNFFGIFRDRKRYKEIWEYYDENETK